MIPPARSVTSARGDAAERRPRRSTSAHSSRPAACHPLRELDVIIDERDARALGYQRISTPLVMLNVDGGQKLSSALR
jgi:hypothetical protein